MASDRSKCRRFLLAAFASTVVLMTGFVSVARSATTIGFAGQGQSDARHMDIELRLNHRGYAIWRVDFFAPCTPQDTTSRTIGTDVQPPTPRLRFIRGHFTLRQRVVIEASDLDQIYSISGRLKGRRIVGTFRAVEHQYGDTCDTGILRWSARRAATPSV